MNLGRPHISALPHQPSLSFLLFSPILISLSVLCGNARRERRRPSATGDLQPETGDAAAGEGAARGRPGEELWAGGGKRSNARALPPAAAHEAHEAVSGEGRHAADGGAAHGRWERRRAVPRRRPPAAAMGKHGGLPPNEQVHRRVEEVHAV